MDRHSRQARLAGIGAGGQANIARASVDVALDGFAADVAVRYLAGAGIGCLRVRTNDLARVAMATDRRVLVQVEPSLRGAPDDSVDLRDPTAIELARGALCALRALRSAVGDPS